VAFGLTYGPQAPGSLTTAWSGTINADLTSGVLTFSGGSTITAIVNPNGPFTTFPNPIGVEPGNYGSTATGPFPGFGTITVNGVYKNLVLDLTSGTAQNGVPLTSTNLKLTSGALDYGIFNEFGDQSVGTSNLVNVNGNNTSPIAVTWDGTTLTLPIKFQTTGSNRVENWEGTIVASLPMAAPTLVNARPYHDSFSGPDKVDSGVSFIQRNASPQTAELLNIISSTQGINGVILDFDNLANLNDLTLEYKLSPQNVFATPIAGWADVPPAPTATLLPDAGQDGADRVRLTWASGTITDRYLCIKVIYNGNTIAELYLGHLRGEMTGAINTKFTVLVGDILAVRTDLTMAKTASGRTDVDKSGTVLVQDILDTRSNLAKELSQITVPATP
jgi:hypothetical protein